MSWFDNEPEGVVRSVNLAMYVSVQGSGVKALTGSSPGGPASTAVASAEGGQLFRVVIGHVFLLSQPPQGTVKAVAGLLVMPLAVVRHRQEEQVERVELALARGETTLEGFDRLCVPINAILGNAESVQETASVGVSSTVRGPWSARTRRRGSSPNRSPPPHALLLQDAARLAKVSVVRAMTNHDGEIVDGLEKCPSWLKA